MDRTYSDDEYAAVMERVGRPVNISNGVHITGSIQLDHRSHVHCRADFTELNRILQGRGKR